jgi:hypothetical protein
MNVTPLLTKPVECKCESDLRGRTQVYARDMWFKRGLAVTLQRVYDSIYQAEIRCPETNRRWVVA